MIDCGLRGLLDVFFAIVLCAYTENNFTIPDIAEMLSVSKMTVANRLREYHMKVRDYYCVITDEHLDSRVAYYMQLFPNAAPVAKLLAKRFGFRKVFLVASMLNSAAVSLTSCVDNLYVAIVLRILAGYGLAVQIHSLLPYLLCRFRKYAAFAQCIRSVALSAGTFVFSFLINYCLGEYGWRGCCLIIGAIAFQQWALGCMFTQWSDRSSLELHEGFRNEHNHNNDSPKRLRDIHQLDLFKRKVFLAFVLHSFVLLGAVSTIYVHVVSGTKVLLEISSEQARFTLSAIALSNLVGRFIVPLMTKHPKIDSLTLHMILNALLAIQVCVIPFVKGNVRAQLVSASVGFLLSGFGCLYPLIQLELFGNEYLFMSYAYSVFFGGFAYLFGAPVAGWLYDITQDYAISFYFCAGLLITSVAILIPGCV